MVVTITRDGFIKRTTLETFRAQNRGGRGRTGAGTRGDDIVTRSFNAPHPSMGAVLLARRQGVPRKGLAAAGSRPDREGPRAGQPAARTWRRYDHHGAAAAAGRNAVGNLHLVFATASGNVRRNRLSDFRNVRAAGLIAMKLDEGDHLIGVATCREGDDVLLATRKGRCIRFQLSDDTVRVFAGRDSSGVRGIKLLNGDEVISLSVLRHVEATPEEREAYLRIANAKRAQCQRRRQWRGRRDRRSSAPKAPRRDRRSARRLRRPRARPLSAGALRRTHREIEAPRKCC